MNSNMHARGNSLYAFTIYNSTPEQDEVDKMDHVLDCVIIKSSRYVAFINILFIYQFCLRATSQKTEVNIKYNIILNPMSQNSLSRILHRCL